MAYVKTRPVAERIEVAQLLGDDIMRSPETARSLRLLEIEQTAMQWHLGESLSSHSSRTFIFHPHPQSSPSFTRYVIFRTVRFPSLACYLSIELARVLPRRAFLFPTS